MDISARLDWLGVVVGAFRVELSAVLERIVEVGTSGDVSVRAEEADVVDSG